MSCGKDGVSEATWTDAFGRVRNSWNSAICAASSRVGGARPAHVLRRDRPAVARLVLGAAVGEEQGQLRARQARPGAHAVGIEVHERRRRGRVVADPAALADEGRVAQLLHRHVGEMHVHRLAEDVAALARLAADGAAQHVVGAARAVAGDDVDRLGRAQLGVHLPDQIDEVGVHLRRLVLAPVAQDPVDLLHRLGDALAVLHVLDGQRLLGVDAVEGDGAIARGVGGDAARAGHQRKHRHRHDCGYPANPRWQARSLIAPAGRKRRVPRAAALAAFHPRSLTGCAPLRHSAKSTP